MTTALYGVLIAYTVFGLYLLAIEYLGAFFIYDNPVVAHRSLWRFRRDIVIVTLSSPLVIALGPVALGAWHLSYQARKFLNNGEDK